VTPADLAIDRFHVAVLDIAFENDQQDPVRSIQLKTVRALLTAGVRAAFEPVIRL
jgi:hypothetical protein